MFITLYVCGVGVEVRGKSGVGSPSLRSSRDRIQLVLTEPTRQPTFQLLKQVSGSSTVSLLASHLLFASHIQPWKLVLTRTGKLTRTHSRTQFPKIWAFSLKLVFFHTFSFAFYLSAFSPIQSISASTGMTVEGGF